MKGFWTHPKAELPPVTPQPSCAPAWGTYLLSFLFLQVVAQAGAHLAASPGRPRMQGRHAVPRTRHRVTGCSGLEEARAGSRKGRWVQKVYYILQASVPEVGLGHLSSRSSPPAAGGPGGQIHTSPGTFTMLVIDKGDTPHEEFLLESAVPPVSASGGCVTNYKTFSNLGSRADTCHPCPVFLTVARRWANTMGAIYRTQQHP